MKIKRKDLELLMKYLEAEKPELVDIVETEDLAGFKFTFDDSKRVMCSIKIYNSSINATPDLLRTTKLYTNSLDKKD